MQQNNNNNNTIHYFHCKLIFIFFKGMLTSVYMTANGTMSALHGEANMEIMSSTKMGCLWAEEET